MPLHVRVRSALLALLALPLLVWPALVNRYPLLFPDTLEYLAQGRPIVYALLHRVHPAFGGMRSAIYSLGIYPFHLDRNPWPILALHAAIVVYTVYLTVRSIRRRGAFANALLIIVLLSVVTGMSWYISLLMPDILGGPLYLALYLLVFARGTLSRAEQGIVAALAVFCATSHSTHLLIAMLLCGMLWIVRAAVSRSESFSRIMGRKSLSVMPATVVVGAAILLQLAVNARLFGHATLDGNRPPYLEARLVADGPARLYLERHCAQLTWVLCRDVAHLPTDDDAFLWAEGGIWPSANAAQQRELRREELPLALATLRAYPRQQLAISAENAWQQLTSFGLDDFDNNDYMQSNLERTVPHSRAAYDRSLQAHNAVPWHGFTVAQNVAVLASLLLLCLTLPQQIRLRNTRALGLSATIISAVVLNAMLTGVLSEVDSRYQARVVWLIPLLSAQLLLARQPVRVAQLSPSQPDAVPVAR